MWESCVYDELGIMWPFIFKWSLFERLDLFNLQIYIELIQSACYNMISSLIDGMFLTNLIDSKYKKTVDDWR